MRAVLYILAGVGAFGVLLVLFAVCASLIPPKIEVMEFKSKEQDEVEELERMYPR